MSQVNANRAPQTPSSPSTSQLGAALLASTPLINNKSNSSAGDPLGNAASSLLVYMFDVLPGRVTGRLAPATSEAQSQTPQLMASVHAQDAVAAQQQSWDSVWWVRAGDALAAGFGGLGQVAGYVSERLPSLTIGPQGAHAASTIRPPMALSEIESALSQHFTVEKSKGLLAYQKTGGEHPDHLVIFLADGGHSDDAIQATLHKTVRALVRPAHGDRLMRELAHWETASQSTLKQNCPIDLKYCTFYTEPSEEKPTGHLLHETVNAFMDAAVWMRDAMPKSEGVKFHQRLISFNYETGSCILEIRDLMLEFGDKVYSHLSGELDTRYQTLTEIHNRYIASVHATSPARSTSYISQTLDKRAAMPKEARLLSIQGEAHIDDFKDDILRNRKKNYLVATMKATLLKDEL